MSKPVYSIEAIDKITHSRTITVENLIELFKDHCGAPESAQVLFNYSVGDLKRKIEIVWSEDAPKRPLGIPTETTIGCVPGTQIQERAETPCPPPIITFPVATYNVQVGDLVMVRDESAHRWIGPRVLTTVETEPYRLYRTGDFGWREARHLTDEERAKIKRI